MSKLLASRRRSTPWIHRWARPIIGAIALIGIVNTSYLTITKLSNTAAVCPSGGCEQVLSSPYATVFGLPLSLFGLLAYVTMAILSLGPLAVKSDTQKQLRTSLEKWTWLLMFVLATAMTVISGYLMFIMFSQFVAKFGVAGICYYCVFSAVSATTLFVLTLIGHEWEDAGQLMFTGVIVAMVALVTTLVVYSPIGAPSAGSAADAQIQSASGQTFFTIKNTSGDAEMQLARYLKSIGAKEYGAYWCPHCYEQKELFGYQAAKELNYMECAPDGKNSQTALCQKIVADVQKQTGQQFGFPTWEINGKFYPGVQKLEKLAELSGYKGPMNFKNTIP
jgi:uncharacterized membrane protein